jgi:hypothetical protein
MDIKLEGLANIVDELKETRCHCYDKTCVNNLGWERRRPLHFSEKCTLPSIRMDKDGKCEDRYTEDELVGRFDGISYQAVEAFQKTHDLLRRVLDESTPISTDLYRINSEVMQEVERFFNFSD